MFINVLKEIGFLDADGVPTSRYYEFLDRSQSEKVVAEGVRDAYSDLFAVNRNAHQMSVDDVKNKLRTLYHGQKKDNLISRIASTFVALCEYADFSPRPQATRESAATESAPHQPTDASFSSNDQSAPDDHNPASTIGLDSLQYHINIVLPESRDPSVYDAIFKSLKDHLGR